MPRLSIDISDTQHQQLKATAAINGKSIKDFVLECTLGELDMSESEALAALAAQLRPRIERAQRGQGGTSVTMADIIAEAKHERGLA